MDENSLENQSPKQFEQMKRALLLYVIVSVIFTLIFAIAAKDTIKSGHKLIYVTFWMRCGLFIFGPIGGTVGMCIGRLLRDWVHPSFIMTSGGMTGLVKAKLFWAIGPQTIGLFIGEFVTMGIFLTLAA